MKIQQSGKSTVSNRAERDEVETLHLCGQRQAFGCVLRLPFKGLGSDWMDHLVNISVYERGRQS